jgi:hypothetical protein
VLTLIPNHSIDTLIRDIVILERERISPILVEQDLEMVVLTAMIVVRSIVLECKRSRGRGTINFVVDTLRSILIDVQIGPKWKYRTTSH